LLIWGNLKTLDISRPEIAMQNKSRLGQTMLRRQAVEKYIQEGDFMLLDKNKENKLSPRYEKEPYQVMTRHGDQVQLN